MARFAGRIGFAVEQQTSPGVTVEKFVERVYFGDLLRNKNTLQSTDNLNGTIVLQNQVSVVADPYVFENYFAIRYVNWNNVNWAVTAVDVAQYPRVILSLGGAYNGETAETEL